MSEDTTQQPKTDEQLIEEVREAWEIAKTKISQALEEVEPLITSELFNTNTEMTVKAGFPYKGTDYALKFIIGEHEEEDEEEFDDEDES